jgi:hypothetical protein
MSARAAWAASIVKFHQERLGLPGALLSVLAENLVDDFFRYGFLGGDK